MSALLSLVVVFTVLSLVVMSAVLLAASSELDFFSSRSLYDDKVCSNRGRCAPVRAG